ncbi:hypothetical protein GSI_06211 [Ganoderma sinense ZZ0214-1]|uniref:Uncharacterized protein n=1 Tax=Ganoderma sinense ZZ0214-1 TaxID=1077348 RepID=A0A2G8SCL8_9APHY|nr:hypothetical protein GSI_06211 [Ganoderma sinense ZZ0214-1]
MERSAPDPKTFDHVLHITAQPSSSPPPDEKKRFIVEPQVLNAAFEFEIGQQLGSSSSTNPTAAPGGLPPPPRPTSRPNSRPSTANGSAGPPRPTHRKGRSTQSTISSPITSDDHSNVVSLPSTPLSPYPASPDTLVTPTSAGPKSPRLSNFLRGESLPFSTIRRQSLVDQNDNSPDVVVREDETPTGLRTPRDQTPIPVPVHRAAPIASLPSSPIASLPSSPETAPDMFAARPSRQFRYLTGLQKITKLGKSKSISVFSDGSVRSERRRSDADLQPGSESLKKSGSSGDDASSSRYRRMLDKGVRMAAKSVPNSPVSPPYVSNTVAEDERVKARDPKDGGSWTISQPPWQRNSFSISRSDARIQSPSATLRSAVATSPAAMTQASPSGSVGIRDERARTNGGRGRAVGGASPGRTSTTGVSATAGVANPGAGTGHVTLGSSPRIAPSHGRYPSSLASSSTNSSSSRDPSASSPPAPASSDFSHELPPSSYTEPRISISSTIYSSSSNQNSFDIAPYPPSPPAGRPSMSPDRESFIDLASPTFSPSGPDPFYVRIPSSHRSQPEQPSSATSRSGESSYGKSSSRSSSPPPSSGSTKPRLAPITSPSQGAEKPPIPTAPKPDFSYRSRTSNKSSPVQSKKPSPMSPHSTADADATPSSFAASNALSPKERAERVRTTRKLAQVFGQPPGVSPIAQEPSPQELYLPNGGCMPLPGPLTLNLNAKRRHHRPVVSMSDDVPSSAGASAMTPVYDATGAVVWPPAEGTRYVSLAPRRHSAPLSPDDFAFVVHKSPSSDHSDRTRTPTEDDHSPVIHIGPVQRSSLETLTGTEAELGTEMGPSASHTVSSRRSRVRAAPGSPTSFMDLSDEEGANDGISEILPGTPKLGPRGRGQPRSPSTASLAESLTSDELAEDERRRKREKLAKLHRFLGSRVPPHLVLGPLDEGTPLPPPASNSPSPSPAPLLPPAHSAAPRRTQDNDDDIRRAKMRRRRSSSAAEFSHTWSDDIDRLKQGLNDREKAINVRRAVKMEKMFGVAPPQTLYHTRAPTISTPNVLKELHRQPSPKPCPKTPTPPPFRFTTTPIPAGKSKKTKRPGTSESAKPLIANDSFLEAGSSSVYMHYRHSLNSLSDILDRDDRESLAELHDYLTGNGELYCTGDQYDYKFDGSPSSNGVPVPGSPMFADDTSIAFASPSSMTTTITAATATMGTPRPERRRSLPSRVSVSSFSSEISALASPPLPDEASFQQRRRRAAKLTHFFGVDYRHLMTEILESIERGLEEERGKGTLRPDEVKDLQQKLVTLRTKRNSLNR